MCKLNIFDFLVDLKMEEDETAVVIDEGDDAIPLRQITIQHEENDQNENPENPENPENEDNLSEAKSTTSKQNENPNRRK